MAIPSVAGGSVDSAEALGDPGENVGAAELNQAFAWFQNWPILMERWKSLGGFS